MTRINTQALWDTTHGGLVKTQPISIHSIAWMFLVSVLLVVLGGCAHQASTTSVKKTQDQPVKLTQVDFVFVPREFTGIGYQQELHKIGYYSGSLASELGSMAKAAFLANGIEATILTAQQAKSAVSTKYRFVVRPTKLKVFSYKKSWDFYSTLELEILLFQQDTSDAIWTGRRVLSFEANDRRTREVGFGDLTLAVLNSLQSSSVITLPRGYRIGTRINMDVLNAQQQLHAAQRDLFKARADTLMQSLRLKAAIGDLHADALQALNALLVAPAPGTGNTPTTSSPAP